MNELPEVGSRIGMYNLPTRERDALSHLASSTLDMTGGEFPQDVRGQQLIGELVSHSLLAAAAPGVASILADAKSEQLDCVLITGLPSDKRAAPFLVTVLGSSLGKLFNYKSQNGGELLMKLAPTDDSPDNTNTTRSDFDWHSDDAWVRSDCRVAWICLQGVINPPDTRTAYAPIQTVVPRLSMPARDWLFSTSASVRAPLSFGLGDDVWSGPRAILKRVGQQRVEIAWPKYATRPIDPVDQVAARALTELAEAIESNAFSAAIDPGCFFALNNLRGVHKRTPIGPGDRLVYRVYARDSLDPLREATGEDGPIFDLTKMM
jgi:hypothetical protein